MRSKTWHLVERISVSGFHFARVTSSLFLQKCHEQKCHVIGVIEEKCGFYTRHMLRYTFHVFCSLTRRACDFSQWIFFLRDYLFPRKFFSRGFIFTHEIFDRRACVFIHLNFLTIRLFSFICDFPTWSVLHAIFFPRLFTFIFQMSRMHFFPPHTFPHIFFPIIFRMSCCSFFTSFISQDHFVFTWFPYIILYVSIFHM